MPEAMLKNIRQIPGISGIVSEIPAEVGSVWPRGEIRKLRELIESYGLSFEVVESVKIHEDIKLGLPSRDKYIDAFNQTLRNLSSENIKVVCYDFMPVFDWMRTDTRKILPDGSETLVYYEKDLHKTDPLINSFALPDWEAFYSPQELARLFDLYKTVDENKLWENLAFFLNAVIPVAEECKIRLGMHPDDPCWPIFGLPRIITCEENIDRFLSLYDSPYNALTLCSGSLGCGKDNDVARLVNKYCAMDRIAFGHMRNVKLLDADRTFEESAHYSSCGSLDFPRIVKAYHDNGFTGYIRPDHGRMIWGETGSPGYGLYDRALGAMYILGIWETLDKFAKSGK